MTNSSSESQPGWPKIWIKAEKNKQAIVDCFPTYAIRLNEAGFLNLGTVDVLRVGWGACPTHCRTFSGIPGICSLDASSTLCPQLWQPNWSPLGRGNTFTLVENHRTTSRNSALANYSQRVVTSITLYIGCDIKFEKYLLPKYLKHPVLSRPFVHLANRSKRRA